MCGIAGIFDPRAATGGDILARDVTSMVSTLGHRGPDDAGEWTDAAAGIALGHRRLAVLDLSQAGHQPMISGGGRHVLSYNGEIYNFKQLRSQLESIGATFRGHSDTEVLLAGIEAWGVHETLLRSNGMFALALWDRRERALTLARDRLGEKPLYYGRAGENIVFASELAAIRRHPQLRERVDRTALATHLRYGYVPGPRSILEGVAKLGPGELLTIGPGACEQLAPTRWWSLSDVARVGREKSRAGADLGEELREMLGDAVNLRLAADVPLGALLSGGVDSATLVALMRHHGGGTVRTFTVGFEDPAFDETTHAAAVAAHLGTDHTELRISGADALAAVPELASVCDEPFADPALLPTLLIARLARRHVTVAFAGDGGDELFHGYSRYRWGECLDGTIARLPPSVRRGIAGAMLRLPVSATNRVGAMLGGAAHELLGDRLLKLAELAGGAPHAGVAESDRLYERLVACWLDSPVLGAGAGVNLTLDTASALDPMLDTASALDHRLEYASSINPKFNVAAACLAEEDHAGRMALADSLTYLPDDILTKVDRATMSVGLEARVPLLDHRLVELAWRIDPGDMRAGTLGKAPLREILHRYVPRELVDRPKRGFEVPLADWLRGPLKPWAQDMLAPGRLATEGFFEPSVIMRHWREHQSGRRNWHRRLWPVLMFQSWLSSSND